jgi:uncharacterized cupin superfamily protein
MTVKHPLRAAAAPERAQASNYPAPFAARMAGRTKKPLGDVFGIVNFGVNLTRLAPGSQSALRHRHTVQDEFVYVLEGEVVAITDDGEFPMTAGMCLGFPKSGSAHHLVNRSAADAVYLEIGDRTPGETASYPDDDLAVAMGPDGRWRFSRKDGTPY